MKKIKILFLTTSLTVGGAEKMLFETARNLNKDIYEPVVCCVKNRGYYGDLLLEEGIAVSYLGMGDGTGIFVLLQVPRVIMKLILLIKKTKPAILHSYLFRANFLGRIAGRVAGVPVIISSIRRGYNEKRYHFFLYRLTNRLADIVIANSNNGRNYAIKHSGLKENKGVVIYNGIAKNSMHPAKTVSEIKKELGLGETGAVIGMISRLHRVKGHSFLLKAAVWVLKKHPGTRFIIAGDGGIMNELKSDARKLGIEKEVIFTGERNDTANLMQIFDVFVLPSFSEGISNSIMEAMLMGKPVISTRVGGTAELVKDNETGILIEPGDENALSEKIIWMIENKEKAKQLGAAGKKTIEENFTMEAMISGTEKVYKELLSRKGI